MEKYTNYNIRESEEIKNPCLVFIMFKKIIVYAFWIIYITIFCKK